LKPERKFYEKIKKNITSISWIRLENNSLLGTPDLLGYNTNSHFFTVELKVTKANKIKFSPHQIAFHVKHPDNTFILVSRLMAGGSKLFEKEQVYLYRGKRIQELAACGLSLDACRSGLDDCINHLERLGA
jgi:hypothetical protein